MFLFTISFHAEAKKIPSRWKGKHLLTVTQGFEGDIRKRGNDQKARQGDFVLIQIAYYDTVSLKKTFSADENITMINGGAGLVQISDTNQILQKAICLLGEGGEGFFRFRKGKTTLCFIRVREIPRKVQLQQPAQQDTIYVKPPAADESVIGDSLFTVLKLSEVPVMNVSCDSAVMYMTMKFYKNELKDGQLTRTEFLVAVECPATMGENYFVKGASYVITAIPLREKHRLEKKIMDPYSGENTSRYLCLKIRKV
ncbi:MAG: hypothetical protein Fur0041_22630 [Bacteroidia bacterium]